MTKAFTSSLGDGITVKGYIDEDDRLVLLEPEGGGGGGDYDTCTLTIIDAGGHELGFVCPVITNRGMECIDSATAGEHTVPMAEGHAFAYFTLDTHAFNIVTAGDIEYSSDDEEYVITGDCSITITEV